MALCDTPNHCSETNKTIGINLLIELWQKGILWDNVLGYKLIEIDQLFQGNLLADSLANGLATSTGSRLTTNRWFTLDADLLVTGAGCGNGPGDGPTVIGTKTPTTYMVLLELRWELTNCDGTGSTADIDLSSFPSNTYDVRSDSGGILNNYSEANYCDQNYYTQPYNNSDAYGLGNIPLGDEALYKGNGRYGAGEFDDSEGYYTGNGKFWKA